MRRREQVADAAGEIANRGHRKNDMHECDRSEEPNAAYLMTSFGGTAGNGTPLFFLLAPVIQDVITSKIGRGVLEKFIWRPFLKDHCRRIVLTRTERPVRFRGRIITASVLSQSLRNSWACRGCDRSWSVFRTALSGNFGTRPAASPTGTVAFPFKPLSAAAMMCQ